MFAAIVATPRMMLKTERHISWLCKPLANSSTQYTLALNAAIFWSHSYQASFVFQESFEVSQAFNFFSVLSLFWVNIAIIIKFAVQRDRYMQTLVPLQSDAVAVALSVDIRSYKVKLVEGSCL